MLTRLNKHITEHSSFYLIFALAIILRITFMVTQGLSHDELSAWNRLFVADFSELMSVGVGGDMHPAFMQIVLWLWVKVVGDGEFAFRIPTLLFGLGGIALIYATGIRFFSKHAALMAAGALSVFVFPILHTTMARPYSSGFFFAILLVYGILSLRNSEKKTQLSLSLLLILIGLTGAMYSHYYAFMCAAWISFVSLFYLKRAQLIPFVLIGVISLTLFIPHIELTQLHLSKDGLGWLGKPNSFWLFSFFQEFFNSSRLLFILFFGAVSFAYFANRKKAEKLDYYPFLIFFGMYLVGHTLSILYTPMLREPGQLFTLPFFFLGLGHLLSQIEWKKYMRVVVLGAVVVALHSFTLGKLTKTVHFEPFREMVELIDRFDNELGEENILRFTNVTGTNYLNYYARKSGTSLNFEMDLIEEIDSIHRLAELVSTTDKPYAMLARTNRQQNVIQYEIFRHYFPEVKYHEDFFNANFSIWKRGDFANRHFEKEINSINSPALFEKWLLDTNANEFYGGFKIKVENIRSEKTYVLIRTQGWISDEVGTLGFVTVLERDGETIMKNDLPMLYQSWDQCKLIPEKGSRTFFTAFEIPNEAKNSDEIHVYFWNPEKKSVTFSKPSIYVVQAAY